MSDDSDAWGPESSGEQPTASGPGVTTVPLEPTGEVRRAGLGPRLLAAVVGVVLLAGGLAFAALQVGDDDRTPEEAVEELFTALSDEDILGVLATLDPGERDSLSGPLQELFAELQRLEVLSGSFDARKVTGVDLSFEGLQFRTEPVRDDLVRVHLVAGTASYSVNTDNLPIGAFVTDTLERLGVDHRGIQESDRTELGGGDDEFLAVRRGPDGWRVSIGYTAAEMARIDRGDAPPDPAQALVPVGADDPELAVRGLAQAIADVDLPGVLSRLSPAEMRALHDYWPLFADEAELPPEAQRFDVELLGLQLRSESDGDDLARVYVEGFDVAVTAEGTRLQLTYADGCLSFDGDLEDLDIPFDFAPGGERVCQDDFGTAFEDSFGAGAADLGIEVPELEPIRTPDLYLVVHRVDGKWFVAPVHTGLQAVVEGLRAIDRSHLDAIVDFGAAFFMPFAQETTFEEQFGTIEGGETIFIDPPRPPEPYQSVPPPPTMEEPPTLEEGGYGDG